MDKAYNLSPVKKTGLTKGLIADNSREIGPNSCIESINFQFDSGIGEAKIRKGTTRLGSRIDITPILTIYEFKS